jgi:hypothetical protein
LSRRFRTISEFGSKYFGWLAALGIVLAGGWFLLPEGYNTLIQWLAPQLGNYTRPTLVMVNAMLVNPLTNITMFLIWAVGGFVGGIMAGTKKGAIAVGIFTWICCLGILGFSIWQMISDGFSFGAFPPLPPGSSIIDLLTIPLVQSIIGELLPLLAGMSGGAFNPMAMILPLVIWLVVPIVTVCVAGVIGAMVRPKE